MQDSSLFNDRLKQISLYLYNNVNQLNKLFNFFSENGKCGNYCYYILIYMIDFDWIKLAM